MIEKYVEKIKQLWNPDQRVLDALRANKLYIEKKFAPYYWDDVELALEEFYARVDAHQYPRAEQIIARLNTNKGVRKRETDTDGIPVPSTNIRAIQGVYLNVIRWAHREGLCYAPYCEQMEHIKQGNKAYIKTITLADGTTDTRLWNKNWDLEDFIKKKESENPGLFEPFTGLTKWEKTAFLVVKGMLKLK